MSKCLPIAFAVLLLPLAAVPASATSYDLTIDHCSSPGCGLPSGTSYGTVNVTDIVIGQVLVDVTLTSGVSFIDTGFGGAFGFNLTDPEPSPISISIDTTVTTAGTFSLLSGTKGTLGFDGLGNFEYALVCNTCGGGSNPYSGELKFTVFGTGLTAASFAEKSSTPPGDTPAFFVADVVGPNGLTGPVGSVGSACPDCGGGQNSFDPIPEPASLLLLGSGLAMVARRTRRKKNA